MLIAYRPELENPPRDAGFGIITKSGLIQLTPGLNQEIPDEKWKEAKENGAVKKLLAIGAIEEMQEQVMVDTLPENVQSLSELPLVQAIRAIELIHDSDRLSDWKKIEGLFPPSKNTEKLSIGKNIFPPGKEIMFSDGDDFLAVTQLMDEMKIPYHNFTEKMS